MPTFEAILEEISGMLDVPDEALTPEQKEAMDAYLDELGQQEEQKVDGLAQFIRLEEARALACREEAKRLTARASTAEKRIAYLKGMYADSMLRHGLKKINGQAYSISLGRTEKVSAPDTEAGLLALPPQFVRRKEIVEADKQAIKNALKSGQIVPGCALVESHSLRIR